MQSKLIDEIENKLFNRKEIQINIEAEVTPSHKEAKELISEKFSTQLENIRIKKISGKFGTKIFTISANIYPSEEEKNKIEIFSKKEAEREKKPEPIVETPTEQLDEDSTLKEEQKISNEIVKEEAQEEKAEETKQEGTKTE